MNESGVQRFWLASAVLVRADRKVYQSMVDVDDEHGFAPHRPRLQFAREGFQ
jgi:hypothetical protein